MDTRKYDYIDALRGIAILMVVLVHTSQHIDNLNMGLEGVAAYCQLGVQLFFVASALTMCLSYASSMKLPPWNRNLAFAFKRFFRIAPLYYLAIPVYCALWAVKGKFLTGSIQMPADYSLAAIASNVLFIHDFVPIAQNNIVPGGWSIGVEMLFYAMFPVLFGVFHRFGFAIKPLIAAILVALVANVAGNLIVSNIWGNSIANQSFAYYFLPNHSPVFLIGFLVYSLVKGGSGSERNGFVKLFAAAVCVGFLAITVGLWLAGWKISFLLIPTMAGASFGGLAVLASRMQKFPYGLRQIGILSYPIYILHFICTEAIEPVLVRKWDGHLPGHPNLQLLAFFIFNVAVAFAMAFVVHRLLEQPGINLGRKLAERAATNS